MHEVDDATRNLDTPHLLVSPQPRLGAFQAATALSAAVSQLTDQGQHIADKMSSIVLEVVKLLHSLIDHIKVLAAVDSEQLTQSISELTVAVTHACKVLLDKYNSEDPDQNDVGELKRHLNTVVATLIKELNDAASKSTPIISQKIMGHSKLVALLSENIATIPDNTASLKTLVSEVDMLSTIANFQVTRKYIHSNNQHGHGNN